MSNANNLKNGEATQFRAGGEQAEIARQGGIASGKARREKKTVQKILGDFLDSDITKNKSLESLAKKIGISTDGSIKDLVTAVCVLNTLKKGDVSELEKIAKLLGEESKVEVGGKVEDDALTKSLKELARELDNKEQEENAD